MDRYAAVGEFNLPDVIENGQLIVTWDGVGRDFAVNLTMEQGADTQIWTGLVLGDIETCREAFVLALARLFYDNRKTIPWRLKDFHHHIELALLRHARISERDDDAEGGWA